MPSDNRIARRKDATSALDPPSGVLADSGRRFRFIGWVHASGLALEGSLIAFTHQPRPSQYDARSHGQGLDHGAR